MKRLLAYLCAVALAWAPSLNAYALSDVLKIIIFTPPAAAPAGGTVTYDTSIDGAAEDDTPPFTTSAMTIASTSGRYALVVCMKDDGAETLDSAAIGSQAATAIAAQYTSTWHHVRQFEVVGASVPTGSQTAACTASAAPSRIHAAAVVYNGVNATPKNSTATATTGSVEDPDVGELTITVTTVTGGKAVAIASITNDSAGTVTINDCNAGVTIRQTETLVLGTLAILEKDNTAGTTTITCDIFGSAGTTSWRVEGYGIQP